MSIDHPLATEIPSDLAESIQQKVRELNALIVMAAWHDFCVCIPEVMTDRYPSMNWEYPQISIEVQTPY